MTNNKHLPIFALILLLATLLMGMNNAKAQNPPPPMFVLFDGPTAVTGLAQFTVWVEFDRVVRFEHNNFLVENGIPQFPDFGEVSLGRIGVRIIPDGMGDITLTIPVDSVKDSDVQTIGNAEANTYTVSFTADTTPPTVAMPVPEFDVIEQSDSFMVTVTFSEPVTGFDAVDDVTVTTATTLAPVAMGNSGMVYTLAITPGDASGVIMITIPAGVAMDASGNLNTASTTLSLTYTRPVTAVLTLAEPQFISNGRDPFEVTATFSDALDNFIVGDVMVANGTVTASGSGTVYTLTITPTSDTNDPITIQLLEGAGEVGDSEALLPIESSPSEPLQVMVLHDIIPPTVALSDAPAAVNGSDTTFEVTATFSEPVTGFDAVADITVTNGTAAVPVAVSVSSSETSYTLTITPDGMGAITILIPADAAVDAAENPNTPSNTVTVVYDATAPTVVLAGPDPAFYSTEAFDVRATFSEPVTGFDAVADITVTNATAAVPRYVVGTSRMTYTLTITPDGTNGDIEITIPVNAAMDGVGNTNMASDPVTVTYTSDTTEPTVVLTGPATFSSTEAFVVTATFSEDVTGFNAVADITVTNGGTAAAPTPVGNSETTYTLTITPDGTNGNIEITIIAAAAMDGVGNTNTVSSTVTVTYDGLVPTVVLTGPDPATYSSTEAFVVTATFSEAVTGFDAVADITVTNGAAAVPVAVGNSATTYTLTITPDGTNGDIEITIPAAAAMDGAGNTNTVSNTVTVTYRSPDAIAPTVVLSDAPDTANSLAPFAVTATFSEAVTLVPGAEIEVTNVGTATLSGSGAVYTLTITPDGTGDMSITLPADVVVDAAGNGNTASDTVSVAYDATAPTVTLLGPDTLSNLAPFEVTATFSEDVTGLEVAEIVVTNGAVTTLSGSGANYVLTMTPTGNGDLSVTIPRGVAVDAAANGNIASSTLAVVNTIVADTKAAITGFMLDRADKLARNQPGLTRFLQGTGCRGGLSASSTDISGSVAGCMSRGHTWGEISNTWSSDSVYVLATLGVHGFVRDNLIIGGLVQFDAADDDKRNITGRGWLVGPYFVHQFADQNMSFEGRLLSGQTDNDISPLGSYEDSFDTERSLAQLRITGRYGYRMATLMPLLDFTYTEDTQHAYRDTLGNQIGEQGVDLTQLTFGVDFNLPMEVQTGQLDLTGGLSGTYSEVSGGQSDVEGGRGRAELGLNYRRDNGTTLRAGTFYDGISSDHESFGVNLSFDMKF